MYSISSTAAQLCSHWPPDCERLHMLLSDQWKLSLPGLLVHMYLVMDKRLVLMTRLPRLSWNLSFLLALTGTSHLASCSWWPVKSWRWAIRQQWERSWVSMLSLWSLVWCCMVCSSCLRCTSSSPKRAPSSTYGESCKPCSSPWQPLPGEGNNRRVNKLN